MATALHPEFQSHVLRAERNKRGWQQEDLAARLGVHRNTVSKAENGYASRKLAGKLATLFGIPVASFYETPRKSPTDGMSEQERSVFDEMRADPRSMESITLFVSFVRAARLSKG